MGIEGKEDVCNEGSPDDLSSPLFTKGLIDQIDQSEGEGIDKDGCRNNDATQLDRFGGGHIGDQFTGDVESDEDRPHGEAVTP